MVFVVGSLKSGQERPLGTVEEGVPAIGAFSPKADKWASSCEGLVLSFYVPFNN